jgi:hypothetical protein
MCVDPVASLKWQQRGKWNEKDWSNLELHQGTVLWFFKYFRQKWRFWVKLHTAGFCKKMILIGFEKNANFLPKIGENRRKLRSQHRPGYRTGSLYLSIFIVLNFLQKAKNVCKQKSCRLSFWWSSAVTKTSSRESGIRTGDLWTKILTWEKTWIKCPKRW